MAPLIIPIGLTNQKKLDFIKQTHVTTTWYLLHTTLSSWTSVCNRGAAQISVVTASLIPSSQYLSKTLNTNKQSMDCKPAILVKNTWDTKDKFTKAMSYY